MATGVIKNQFISEVSAWGSYPILKPIRLVKNVPVTIEILHFGVLFVGRNENDAIYHVFPTTVKLMEGSISTLSVTNDGLDNIVITSTSDATFFGLLISF